MDCLFFMLSVSNYFFVFLNPIQLKCNFAPAQAEIPPKA